MRRENQYNIISSSDDDRGYINQTFYSIDNEYFFAQPIQDFLIPSSDDIYMSDVSTYYDSEDDNGESARIIVWFQQNNDENDGDANYNENRPVEMNMDINSNHEEEGEEKEEVAVDDNESHRL